MEPLATSRDAQMIVLGTSQIRKTRFVSPEAQPCDQRRSCGAMNDST